MIIGTVNSHLEAVIRLRLRGPGGTELEVDALVDTGFTGFMTLPPAKAHTLALIRQSQSSAVMADGSVRQFDLFPAEVQWNGWKSVLLSAVGGEALVGMSLLAGHDLRIAVTAGGAVEITPRLAKS